MTPLLVTGILFLHMSLIWFWYRYQNNPSVVDVGWASGLTLSGLIYLNSHPLSTRSFFLSLILIIWGGRLGFYLLFTRIRKGSQDKRYDALSHNWQIAKPLGFFLNFQLQGLFILIIGLPWYFAAQSPSGKLSLTDCLAFGFALMAIGLEALADQQLQQFKHTNPGKVCDWGLWYYSRHPNYFFEWLVWCAFTLFALPQHLGWLAMLSPLTLYYLMTRITGPMTEKGSIESKGKLYTEYQEKTPMFFPKYH